MTWTSILASAGHSVIDAHGTENVFVHGTPEHQINELGRATAWYIDELDADAS